MRIFENPKGTSTKMNEHKSNAATRAVAKIKKHQELPIAADVVAELLAGNRRALAEAITLVESSAAVHSQLASEILNMVLPKTGNSIRIGITGVPGVGKSTFIDAFGMHLIGLGKKVAVLAIDPSSPLSGGSILGDKTRMESLSMNQQAFVRPSPSASTLGGVARKTRETMMLCEAAGFDVIIVETVGVGQSETAVHAMTDFFLLLMLSGAGDQLQGIKRGIMEMCDGMLITKADQDNVRNAQRAQGEYLSALHLFPAHTGGWTPRVEVCSALNGTGIDSAWTMISEFEKWHQERGLFQQRRQEQDISWMRESLHQRLVDALMQDPEKKKVLEKMEDEVKSGTMSPFAASERLVSLFLK
jgi:LAO/AO transport system kinase